jgi:xylulokinase
VRAANQCTVLMSMLTDNRRTGALVYDETLLELAGLTADKLPPLLPIEGVVGTVLPQVADELGISRAAQVVCAANDTHALSMGTGVFKGDHMGASFGTTSVAVAYVDEKRTDAASQMTTMPSPLPGRFLIMAENGIGAGSVRHLLDKVIYQDDAMGRHKPDDLFAQLDAAASGSPPGAKGVMFLPWMIGSGAPASSSLARGAFLNLTLAAERADLVRAALEGVALNFRWLVDHCEAFCGRKFSSVIFAGGGARSPLWSGILADVLRKPVRRGASPAYVNCQGTAMLAFLRLGLSDLDALAAWVRADHVHAPDPARADLYDRLLPVLIEAHGALQPLNAKLDLEPQ